MKLPCPHCQTPVDIDPDDSDAELTCNSCGSSFHLDPNRTQTWSKEKLPLLRKFELIEAVGRGAFGTVYRARDTQLQRTVAVKVPRSGQLITAEDEDRFVREARSVAQLQHSGIVSVFEVGRSDDFPYIVSEFVEGMSLADTLTARRFNLREAAQLVSRVAQALQHAHDQGVVHRDLKPSNIMLATDGSPRVMDFGLAKRNSGEVTVTLEGQVLGTPAYMSPEQARGQGHQVDGRSDVYSLGVVLYELIAGEPPFRGNPRMLLNQVLNAEPRPPRSLDDQIPRDLETICLRAMAKESTSRYASAKEMSDDLNRWLAGDPIKARPATSWELFTRWAVRPERTRDAGVLGTFICAMCLLFLATWLVYFWVTGVEIPRPAEFVWQGAVVNLLLVAGIVTGRFVIKESLAAMWFFLLLDLVVVAALMSSLGNWLPAGIRFRAGGVYDNAMVRVTLFSTSLAWDFCWRCC